ncbi:MAG: GAF domain-containing protein [Planctomycetota bacterium]|nr:GAF domain-containing protein [Planctomycetota bacterium]
MNGQAQPSSRDYDALLHRHGLDATEVLGLEAQSTHTVMRRCIDLLWGGVGSTGFSWIGFYEKVAGKDEMVLVCREPKPACSPIGLHGMCGRSWQERRPILINDVRTLGANYIACDPKDQSEMVIPLIGDDGACEGVLDVDSWDVGSFTQADVVGMTRILMALGLTCEDADELSTLHL